MVFYEISRLNNYYGILINTFMYPVKYSNNFFQLSDKFVKAVPRLSKNQMRIKH